MLSISPDSLRACRATAAIRRCSVGGTCIVTSGAVSIGSVRSMASM